MILIIDICHHKMHYYEFVKPIESIISGIGEPFIVKHYEDVRKEDIESCHRIIISGTSLRDMSYADNIENNIGNNADNNSDRFKMIFSSEKPLLGICGGMQLLCIANGCRLVGCREIGLKSINFNASFLGLSGTVEVYELHNMGIAIDASLMESFHIYSRTDCVQAIKHKHRKHFGVMFHPEVRNKDMILRFMES